MQFEELRAVERWASAHQLNLFTRRRTSQGRPSDCSTLFIGVYLSLYTNLYLSRCWAPHDGALVSPLPDVELLTHLSLPPTVCHVVSLSTRSIQLDLICVRRLFSLDDQKQRLLAQFIFAPLLYMCEVAKAFASQLQTH